MNGKKNRSTDRNAWRAAGVRQLGQPGTTLSRTPGGQLRPVEGYEWDAGEEKKTNRTKSGKSVAGLSEGGRSVCEMNGKRKTSGNHRIFHNIMQFLLLHFQRCYILPRLVGNEFLDAMKKPLNKCRAPEHDAKQQVIGYHPLSAWETSGSTLGSMPDTLFRTPTENHLLGAKPRILVCFMQTRLLPARGSSIQTTTMNGQRQAQIPEALPQAPCPAIHLVGMDLHSEKVQLCLTLWRHGSDPVRQRDITTTLAALENTYRNQIPPDALTVMEASGNAFATVRRLEAIGRAAKILPSDIATGMAPPDRINDAIDAYNIAAAYARLGRRTEVWVTS